MITVKSENGRTDRVTVGDTFKVDSTGALLVFDGDPTYGKLVRAYAPGKWADSVLEIRPEEKVIIDWDKLDTLLGSGETLVLTRDQFDTIDYRTLDSVTSAGVTQQFWRKHPISFTKDLYLEEQIVARSRAYVDAEEKKAF